MSNNSLLLSSQEERFIYIYLYATIYVNQQLYVTTQSVGPLV